MTIKNNNLPDFSLPSDQTSLREGTAISNLDGRLWNEVGLDTGRFFGDEALARARIGIESRYLVALSEAKIIRKLNNKEIKILLDLHKGISKNIYKDLREIEAKNRHDVISMTLMMQKLLKGYKSFDDILSHGWVHWGLTSEDVDNLAKSVLVSKYLSEIYLPCLKKTILAIVSVAQKYKDTVIPAKTHLQNAIPTTFGKEIILFASRLTESFEDIKNIKLRGKLTGAVGNLSAHKLAYPKTDWMKFSAQFIESLGLDPMLFTTQVESKIKLIKLFRSIESVNSTLIDLCQDMRLYSGFNWLTQEAIVKEFGSSTMPQKINPIDFENAQGNALISNWVLEGLSQQLPISWLQRDLVDKTIQRNTGLPFGYSLIALISCQKGLSRIKVNINYVKSELEEDWTTLSEAYQIILRSYGLGGAYENLKKITRGKKLTREDIIKWINNLKVDENIKKELIKINHDSYIGYSKVIENKIIRIINKKLLE